MSDASRGRRGAARAVRATGPRTQREILEAARRLFGRWGLSSVSLADIAAEADVFPSQVTYYFGSKEALFVEAACREMLLVAAEVEQHGRRAPTPEAWARTTVKTALGSPGLLMFAEAMLLARRRAELSPKITRTLQRLHSEGERAMQSKVAEGSWHIRTTPAREAQAFWAAVLGVALEQAAAGELATMESAEAVVLLVLNLHEAGDPVG